MAVPWKIACLFVCCAEYLCHCHPSEEPCPLQMKRHRHFINADYFWHINFKYYYSNCAAIGHFTCQTAMSLGRAGCHIVTRPLFLCVRGGVWARDYQQLNFKLQNRWWTNNFANTERVWPPSLSFEPLYFKWSRASEEDDEALIQTANTFSSLDPRPFWPCEEGSGE